MKAQRQEKLSDPIKMTYGQYCCEDLCLESLCEMTSAMLGYAQMHSVFISQ